MDKCLFLWVAVFSLSLSVQGHAESVMEGTCESKDWCQSLVDIEQVFAPDGFDDNDNAQLVGVGWLPSLCYQDPSALVFPKEDGGFYVLVQAIKKPQSICIALPVPYSITIPLGKIKFGEHTIAYGPNLEQSTMLSIHAAISNEVDEHIYAYVEGVEVDEKNRKIYVFGKNPSECVEFDRFDSIINSSRDVLALLPIMKQVSNDCPVKWIPFKYEYDMPADLTAKNILVHVRSLEGKSKNAMYRNEG